MNWTNEALFCFKYLYSRGYFSDIKPENMPLLAAASTVDYQLVEQHKNDFFRELAENLRKLWPSGNKDGKYPWKDSADNLSRRLQTLWSIRHLEKYSMDDCLRAARIYLSQFEDNVKYMQILKYFILKQEGMTLPNGKIKVVNNSKFADHLESLAGQSLPDEWAGNEDMQLADQFELR